MAERDLASGASGSPGGGAPRDDWDAALGRLLEGVNLDELSVPAASGQRRRRLTFRGVRDHVADQVRDKVRSERLRQEAIERLRRQFAEASAVIEQALDEFVDVLLGAFNGGGEVREVPDSRDGRSRTWQVLGYRSPARSEQREPVVTVQLTMKGVDALDRGQPSLECRVSTPRNPRLADLTAGTDFQADLEDAVCRAYQDIVGTLRFDPSPEARLDTTD